MEPYTPHENLADEVNQAIAEGDLRGGVDLRNLAVGRKLHIYTRLGYYVLEHREGGFYILEHAFRGEAKFAPEPTPCRVTGSIFHPEGSMLKMHWVGRGMFLEFHLNDGPRLISNAEILEIVES